MKIGWKTCVRVGLTVFLLFLAIHYFPVCSRMAGVLVGAARPLLFGCVIAYLLNLLMSTYEKYYFAHSKNQMIIKSRRIVCMSAAVLTLAGLVCLLINMVIPELVSCISVLAVQLSAVLDEAASAIQKNPELSSIIAENLDMTVSSLNRNGLLEKGVKIFSAGVGGMLESVVATASSLASAAVTVVIGAIFAVYLLAGKEQLGGQCRRVLHTYLPSEWERKIYIVLGVLNNSFRRFIVGQCVEAVILGVLCTAGMLLLRFPYATMIGALVGFTALIPVAGAYIGAGIGAFMILTVSPVQAAGFLIYIVILQQLEGNIIYPRVVGSSIGLPGLWVLAAVTVGGGVLGVGGMLLGVPLTAAAYQLLHMDIERRENDRK